MIHNIQVKEKGTQCLMAPRCELYVEDTINLEEGYIPYEFGQRNHVEMPICCFNLCIFTMTF